MRVEQHHATKTNLRSVALRNPTSKGFAQSVVHSATARQRNQIMQGITKPASSSTNNRF